MYTVIARKYRPQTFSEVVNQEHIKQTLRNAMEQGRLAHGYIFAGQRGTGKTTMARLLAKALNCKQGGPEPCTECAPCREIAAGNAVDVIEIDAASNRGIDDIRGLRENARYAPQRDKYKFFIVDEAHQLTKEAWNALLKTLEEPPAHVVFVFCTTESHAIPATISSRCQTFMFHNLGFEETVRQMQRICAAEGIEATEEALVVMTHAADGSMRDALSTLDQAIACCGARLDGPMVRQLLGVVSSEAMDEVMSAVAAADAGRMLTVVDNLVREGQNLRNFAAQITRHIRNLLTLRAAPGAPHLVEAAAPERDRLAGVAAGFSEEDLTRYLQIVLRVYQDLHHSPQPRFHTELGLLKLVHARRLAPLEDLIARVDLGAGDGGGGAGGPSSGGGSGPSRSRPTPVVRDHARDHAPDSARDSARDQDMRRSAPAPSASASSVGAARAPSRPAPPPAASVSATSGSLAERIATRLEELGRMMLGITLENAASWDVKDDAVVVAFPPEKAIHLPTSDDLKLVGGLASEILGRPVTVRAVALKAGQALPVPESRALGAAAAGAADAGSAIPEPATANPLVADFLKHFPGSAVEEQKRIR